MQSSSLTNPAVALSVLMIHEASSSTSRSQHQMKDAASTNNTTHDPMQLCRKIEKHLNMGQGRQAQDAVIDGVTVKSRPVDQTNEVKGAATKPIFAPPPDDSDEDDSDFFYSDEDDSDLFSPVGPFVKTVFASRAAAETPALSSNIPNRAKPLTSHQPVMSKVPSATTSQDVDNNVFGKQMHSGQKRRLEVNEYEQESGNYELPKPKELSTMNAPFSWDTSPQNMYAKGLPPSGIQKNRFPKANSHQQYQKSEDDYSRTIPRPPSLHFRMESSGSVSSLGSTMDGATSMAQQEFNHVIDTLGGDVQNYHNNNADDSDHLPSCGGNAPGNDSRSYFSSFLDNLSLTSSGGSFRSIEDDRADYRKKGQKALKKAQKIKQKANSRNKGWFSESGERQSIRSLSPANQAKKSHRPKLPSIDNDTWDEDEKDESHKKSRSRRGGSLRKKSGKSSKSPIRQNQYSGKYGSVSASKNQQLLDRWKESSRNRGRESSSLRRKQAYESDESENSADESFISSDFTSNQFDNDSDDSSVYMNENDSVPDDVLSFDEHENNNERTSLLPSGISTDELGNPPRSKRKVRKFISATETFIGNMPLTIGAVGLAIVTLGCIWFKFAEEMLDTCTRPDHLNSTQCNFHEFPGCFDCEDTSVKAYQVALGFHQACSAFAGVIALLFVMKICIARKVFVDEMNSPITSSPAGLICMTIVCVAAGRGMIGQILVTVAAAVHFCVAVWFIIMAGSFNILPDPSWYPNTVGIGISAVKISLHYPRVGHFFMLISLSFFSCFFPISLVRVTLNKKISAPVSWIQMSAPAVALYIMTIMAINEYQLLHMMTYPPLLHLFFVAAMLGAISSAQSLYVRWDSFKNIEFSPAHTAFCFPTLAHAGSVQAYRGAIKPFSSIPAQNLLTGYWLFVLVSGTIATLIITVKFFQKLPSWTSVDLDGENEPPAPHETLMSNIARVGDTLGQSFVSPVVLQANEAGAMVQVRKNGRMKYVRTRRVTALGFEPIMDLIDFTNERDALLDWVEENPPRARNRTMSANIGFFGSDYRGVYNSTEDHLPAHMDPEDGRNVATPGSERRQRAQTLL